MSKIAIRNPNANVVLIDDTYENVCVRDYGTITRSLALGHGGMVMVTLSTYVKDGVPPILALRPEAYDSPQQQFVNACIHNVTLTGDTITWVIRIDLQVADAAAGMNCHWWIFDKPVQTLTGTGVVVMRNRNTKRVIFDSDLKYMRVRDNYSTTASHSTRSYAAGKKYAVISLRQYFFLLSEVEPAGPIGWRVFNHDTRLAFRFVGNDLILAEQTNTTDNFIPGAVPPFGAVYDSRIANHMIIDVSGF